MEEQQTTEPQAREKTSFRQLFVQLKTAPKGEKKKIWNRFLQEHEDFRQFIFFSLFSMVCWVCEMASYYLLKWILVDLCSVTRDANWFVFQSYSEEEGGLGLFIAFLTSTLIAQILTFILNRKKTFNATNNVVWAAIMYAVMVAAIIVASAAVNGAVYTGIYTAMLKASVAESVSDFVAGTVSKITGGALAWLINFFMSKFVIMRKKKEKK